MNNEESQRQMEFILNVLAEVTTKISSLTDAQARTETTVAELTGQVQTLTGQVQITAGQVQTLAGQVQTIARQQAHINEVVAVIAEGQQHTDERLNALIDIVQSERNGQS